MTPADRRIPDAEGSSFPYWIIIDPSGIAGRLRGREGAVAAIAYSITGPFLSRASAQAAIDDAPHRYSRGSVVWCGSGHGSPDWRTLCAEPAGMADRLAAAEAEVARLTAELHQAHTDCHALAASVFISLGMRDDAVAHGLRATRGEVGDAIGRAVRRAGGAQ